MRGTIPRRHAGLAIDVAAAGTLAAAIGFAMGAATTDTDLACSAATIAFMLAVAGLRSLEPSSADRATRAPAAAPRGQVVQLASAIRQRDLARSARSRPPEAAADASQALSDALAELRRSLR